MPLESANPPCSLALSHSSYRLPPYSASYMRRYHPYPRSGLSRALEFDDPPMMTRHAHYNGPRLDHVLPTIQEEGTDDLENLHKALSPKSDRAVGFLSWSTLVVDLAFAFRRNLERLRIIRKEDEVLFDLLT
ncbi:hypothetical protein PILCRDRAFT_8775 [Piloderma croceum F 1598]|uniref:Uncharacterized protein n=1 Tax=Piloderma croceum (strain F 1598) TaxID=765440 RepID=A0A0C3FQI6_PILCF|nr:hypothetical protein PILCRDRAFT_8775 [Piloderma croceum F 1598]